jgi:hypothetical protein
MNARDIIKPLRFGVKTITNCYYQFSKLNLDGLVFLLCSLHQPLICIFFIKEEKSEALVGNNFGVFLVIFSIYIYIYIYGPP